MRLRLGFAVAIAVALAVLAAAAPAAAAERPRGMWVWRGVELVRDARAQRGLLAAAARAGVTDLYLYLPAGAYRSERARLAAFLRRMGAQGIAVWGLDGCRCYFRDADGPGGLLATVDAMVAYNARAGTKARFVGFQTDNEPQDQDGYPATFHNGKRDSALSRTDGGVWQASEALDREMLLRDWLSTQRAVDARLRRAGLRSGAAMVSFTEDYYGEPLSVTFAGKRTSAGRHMMAFVDDYVVMTYNTDPRNAAGRAAAQAAYASTLPPARRPRVFASIETNAGVGAGVSYGDTPGKQSKAVALADMAAIARILKRHAAFAGVSIHSWEGWRVLPD